MLDESSLSSTKQMREFLEKIGPQDRVLLVGDTRQHQGVEAGKPFEQLHRLECGPPGSTRSCARKTLIC
jgi:ATP-dependent exoDNAse (exonuclease V) alpha subunit